ncbi:MAG: DUF4349 domain-containing protein [Candidatus Moranbacteria bacterium]|nr:DUF4349 domain-containing protein [Candidatus Moranbacteria bacterium]
MDKNTMRYFLKVGVIALAGIFMIVVAFFIFQKIFLPLGPSSFSPGGMTNKMGTAYPDMMSSSEPMMSDDFGGMQRIEDFSEISSENSPVVPTEAQDQKIIKEGSLNIRVGDADSAVNEIRGVVEYHGGTIFSVNLYENTQGVKSGVVVIKVPVEKFEAAMIGVKEKASFVLQETSSGRDVGEEYIDIQARLTNKQAEEKAFIDILNRADDTEDIIKVTKELSRVRGEIEQMQARLRFLDSRTDMSTITIQISEDQDITFIDTWRPAQEVKEALNKLFTSLRGLVSASIIFIIWFIPMAFIWGVILGGLFFVGRSVYRRMQK